MAAAKSLPILHHNAVYIYILFSLESLSPFRYLGKIEFRLSPCLGMSVCMCVFVCVCMGRGAGRGGRDA